MKTIFLYYYEEKTKNKYNLKLKINTLKRANRKKN
jgi:hypothetical protein